MIENNWKCCTTEIRWIGHNVDQEILHGLNNDQSGIKLILKCHQHIQRNTNYSSILINVSHNAQEFL